MLSKLLKYEFKSTGRTFGLCYAGVVAAALLLRILGLLSDSIGFSDTLPRSVVLFTEFLTGLSGVAYAVMIVAVCVITFLLILQRFYKNLLSGEGYLMHTLPVRPWQHIASKLIAAVVWTVLSFFVVCVSVLVLCADPTLLPGFVQEMAELQRAFAAEYQIPLWLLCGEFILMMLVSLAVSILQIYAAIMLGHQADKHRIAMAVVAYFVIQFALSILMYALILMGLFVPEGIWFAVGSMLDSMGVAGLTSTMLLGVTAANVVLGAIFFVVTEFLMRRRLNLE